jgi:hypothetical protein
MYGPMRPAAARTAAKSIVVLMFAELTRGSINSQKRNLTVVAVDYLILQYQRSIVGEVIILPT